MILQSLGCVGMGLVWGWITEQSLDTAVKVPRLWVLWIAATSAACGELMLLGVSHAVVLFAIASVTSLSVRFIWIRILRGRKTHTILSNKGGNHE
jgi:hypothetical protein